MSLSSSGEIQLQRRVSRQKAKISDHIVLTEEQKGGILNTFISKICSELLIQLQNAIVNVINFFTSEFNRMPFGSSLEVLIRTCFSLLSHFS